MIITRFPPSPTGDLHIGGVRTALYNWLIARKQQDGKFILRIENTDIEREKVDAISGIIEGMKWLGLNWDEGPIFQTDRFDRYSDAIKQLLDDGKAYHCYCSKERLDKLRDDNIKNNKKPKYDGYCRDNKEAVENGKRAGIKPVVRFRNPIDGNVVWNDLVHGEISISNLELDDLIIQRPNGIPTYNFCVVIDDMDMNMTHIIRGDDHINNTPRQINIFKAFNKDIPYFGHVGMILGDDGKKLSKRHGASSILAFKDAGYLPESLLNYLVRLGWSYGDKEIFNIDEMISLFDINNVNKSASTFNKEKLNWLNQHYLKSLPVNELVPSLKYQYNKLGIDIGDYDLSIIIPHYAERAKTMLEMAEHTQWIFDMPISYPEKVAKKAFHDNAIEYLDIIKNKVDNLINWEKDILHDLIASTVDNYNVGFAKVGMPLRLALTGGKPSPGIDDIMLLLGKDKTIAYLDNAICFLNK